MGSSSDEMFMQLAYEQAIEAYDANEMPIGAIIVREGKILGRGRNREHIDSDPTAHAEVVAIREACRSLGAVKVKGSTRYTTIYPCPMCEAASVEAGIKNIVFGGESFSYFRDVRHGPDSMPMSGPIDTRCQDLFEKRLRERGKNYILDHGDV